MKRKNNAFTLIELIAVLVILAILALIVTPLILNIVRNAKDSANKRSVDAYGKAVELSIVTYLLDTGDFPTSINDLEVEYTGKKVVCKIQQLNEASSVYLSECTVGGTGVKDSSTDDGWYHYGKISATVYQSYKIGDEVTYNGMNFYVIENSDEQTDSVTLLKAEPLRSSEMLSLLDSIEIKDKVYTLDEYIKMKYYSRDNCVSAGDISGCSTDYSLSDIKQVIDVWTSTYLNSSVLTEDTTGYSARLITVDELITNLGYEKTNGGTLYPSKNGDNTPEWVYSSNYDYWTMTPYEDSDLSIWWVDFSGGLGLKQNIYDRSGVVRPVVTLLKSAL